MIKKLKGILAEREAWILICAVALVCVVYHNASFGIFPARYQVLEQWVTKGILFFGTPFLFALVALRENPLRLGLGLGDVRCWSKWLLLFILFMALAVLAASKLDRGLAQYYPLYRPARASHREFLLHVFAYAIYMFGWEYFLRGFLLFSLEKRFGDFAAVLQMVPFVFAHLGKPELEVYSSVAGGLILGVLALRTRTMWPCFLIHTFVAIWLDFCLVYIWR